MVLAMAALCWTAATTAWASSRNPGSGDTPPKWYGCISAPHIIFQRQGNKTRCLYRGEEIFKPLKPCLPGQAFRQDYQGTSDYCVTQVGSIVKKFTPGCPGTYKIKRRSGKDICSYKYPDQSWPAMF
jgi:hypothetical protein